MIAPRPGRYYVLALLVALALTLTASRAAAEVHTSPAGTTFVRGFEGFPNKGCPYLDPVGVWTRGFGRIEGIGPGSPCITLGAATVELRRLLDQRYEPAVRALFRSRLGVLAGRFNQHRFDALVSFAYNLGIGAVQCVQGFDAICRAIGSRSMRRIGDAMLLYDKGGGRTLPGLTRRRHAERRLLLRPMARFELFERDEVRWITRYDKLRGHRSARARRVRRALEHQMAERARRITRTIHLTHDGLSRRRGWRVRVLRARS